MKHDQVMSALYDTHAQAERAVEELQASGYDMKRLSIVGQEYHTEEKVVGYYNLGDRMLSWGSTGAFWGSIWSLLFGSAFFLVPGVGPLLIAGPFVVALVAAFEGAVVGGTVSALAGALASIGIPENSVLEYETEIKAGKFLLLAHGTAAEVVRAREILGVGELAIA
ncbi:general stress protein [Hymenobacter caeli]|uniref:Membrane protein n=1 Tax=Hymenobacter caeli TaxID=2735894 RepID=A0ABX2FRM8_9BACT|nr:general stress protein [Hymenobacter caeli]NRT19597.1 putative membrane protein [Hymenobacter caeli]